MDGGGFHDEAASSLALAATTVRRARSRPRFAAALRRSTRRPKGPAWVAEFVRYPCWDRVLAETAGETLETDPESLNAHVESFRAAVLGNESHERVFWDRLSGSGEPDDEVTKLIPVERLEQLNAEIAAWSPTEYAAFSLDWRSQVERAALKQALDMHRLQLAVFTAECTEDATVAAVELAEQELGAELALWIGDQSSRRGVGVQTLMKPLRVSRSDFERWCVPWCYRHSDWIAIDEDMAAVVYSGVPIVGLHEWSATMAKAANVLGGFYAAPKQKTDLQAEVEARYWSAVAAFGAGAGHTINNPLGAIAGFAERLLVAEHDPDRRADLQKVQTQVDRIHRMIRDLHFLGRPRSTVGAANLSECILNGVAKATARFADRPAPRCVVKQAPTEVVVSTAPADLTRLVEELVANGLDAAGPHGFVELRLRISDDSAEIAVVDSGPGFSAADRLNAFSPFYAGRSAGRGLGMGLPVCRRIAERAGGKVVIAAGRPTTVRVQLPIEEESEIRKAA